MANLVLSVAASWCVLGVLSTTAASLDPFGRAEGEAANLTDASLSLGDGAVRVVVRGGGAHLPAWNLVMPPPLHGDRSSWTKMPAQWIAAAPKAAARAAGLMHRAGAAGPSSRAVKRAARLREQPAYKACVRRAHAESGGNDAASVWLRGLRDVKASTLEPLRLGGGVVAAAARRVVAAQAKGQARWLAFTIAGGSYNSMLSEWSEMSWRAGYDELLIACLDDACVERACALSAAAGASAGGGAGKTASGIPRRTLAPTRILTKRSTKTAVAQLKFGVMAQLLHLGAAVTFCELDVFFLPGRSPLPMLRALGADVEVLYAAHQNSPGNGNIGFIYARPERSPKALPGAAATNGSAAAPVDATAFVFGKVAQHVAAFPKLFDQDLFNKCLEFTGLDASQWRADPDRKPPGTVKACGSAPTDAQVFEDVQHPRQALCCPLPAGVEFGRRPRYRWIPVDLVACAAPPVVDETTVAAHVLANVPFTNPLAKEAVAKAHGYWTGADGYYADPSALYVALDGGTIHGNTLNAYGGAHHVAATVMALLLAASVALTPRRHVVLPRFMTKEGHLRWPYQYTELKALEAALAPTAGPTGSAKWWREADFLGNPKVNLGIDAEAGASAYAGGAPRDGGPAVARLVLLSETGGYPRVGWQFWRDGRRHTQWYDAQLTNSNKVEFNTLMWSVLAHAPPEVSNARLLLLAMPFAENINYHFGRSNAVKWLARLRDEQLRWCRIEERCEARGREGCDLFSRRGDDSACTHGTKNPDG